jgi:tetratricopeptide (TPR) repeat protein
MSGTGTHPDGALQTWKEKLAGFETELAICADAPRKFELKKLIEECNREIARLEAEARTGSEKPVQPPPTQPQPWKVRIPPNPFFTGCTEILAHVEKELRANGLVALTGMGGVGKTQIAAQFAHEHRYEYSAVLCTSAASEAMLISDFASTAGPLNLPERSEKDQTRAVAAVRHWLEANGGWLLILDNASDLATVHGFIPQAARGHVLLTTQAQATGDFQAIEVRDMLAEDGALLLLRRSKTIKADSLNNLAELYRAQGKHAKAEPLLRRALFIVGKAEGPDNPHVAVCLNNLATVYRSQGKHTQAEPLYVRALAIWERARGPDDSHVATNLNNLAALYHHQGKFAEAEPLYQRALDIKEKALGPDHPDVATSLNNLAMLYAKQDRIAQAEPLFQRALAIVEKALSPEHPNVAASLNNLAMLYEKQGMYEPLYQRVLAIRKKALGSDHPDVASSLNNLAELYRAQRKYARAEPLYQRALAILEKVLGPDHPIGAMVLENYAHLLHETNRGAEAREFEARAQAIRAAHAKDNPPN